MMHESDHLALRLQQLPAHSTVTVYLTTGQTITGTLNVYPCSPDQSGDPLLEIQVTDSGNKLWIISKDAIAAFGR